MELISECYDLMHNCLGLSNEELHQIFNDWSKGEMQSFLLEITADIFLKKDDKTDQLLLDMIFDRAGAKGTGKWTSQEGLDLPMPIPVIDMAVMMRNLSSLKDERVEASNLYNPELKKTDISKDEFLGQLYDALFFGTIISYAQGLAMLSKASIVLNMKVPMPDVINVWTGGCIIRSALLPMFSEAYSKTTGLKNLLLNEDIANLLKSKQQSLQNIVVQAAVHGYPASGLMASLNYFNGYSRNKLPVNLIQAQRDYFGAHTYERTDGPGIFHTEWKQMDILV
jgi:6-phosphogluconate dehydrogenase